MRTKIALLLSVGISVIPLVAFGCVSQASLLKVLRVGPSQILFGHPMSDAVLIKGRLGPDNVFNGEARYEEGYWEPVSLFIHDQPQGAFGTWGRVPPRILATPTHDRFFVGLATKANTLFDHNGYYVFSDQCIEGFVTEPTTELLELLKDSWDSN